ncbi:endonuclease/exonuclease/phosphatase family protein [Mycolicibacterium neworleansense]|uniref:Exonuclease III n=1 Tax=Mycolicibacterium neworleansense TaxID=146018 RepID=A0A0H5S501_9MYCO|nr:endonuclease/exonuclease/phosphatase family protein [Mycolicibacterium neworleansense]CRZ16239.1 exonuclease III [Mycolicibacterium neworleansense]
MTLRIATLNIRHGGKNADALTTRLLGYDADLLVVTEFRANDTGARLVTRLERAGYETSHPLADPKQNTVLIASRTPIDRASRFTRDLPGHHLWCVEFDGTIVAGVYLPQAHAKLPYWEALIDRARRSEVDLLIGDFNTGNNDLDKDPKGARFIGPEMPGRLIASGTSTCGGLCIRRSVSTRGSAAPVTTGSASTTSSPRPSSRDASAAASSTMRRDLPARPTTQGWSCCWTSTRLWTAMWLIGCAR